MGDPTIERGLSSTVAEAEAMISIKQIYAATHKKLSCRSDRFRMSDGRAQKGTVGSFFVAFDCGAVKLSRI